MPLNHADELPREKDCITSIQDRRWLSETTFELKLARPPAFEFRPGQYVTVMHEGAERAYTMVCAPRGPTLDFCIRHTGGEFTGFLSTTDTGASLKLSGPGGHFICRSSERQAVLVATGTGVAPFVSFVNAGLAGYILLHGVRDRRELYYEDLLRSHARLYVPCVPGSSAEDEGLHPGRVTDYLRGHLPGGRYDFYICGRSDMIRDTIHLIDEFYPGSFVYTEPFF